MRLLSRKFAPCLVIASSVILSGCGGGGGAGTQAAVITGITAQGGATPLWTTAGPPPICPEGVSLNSSLAFSFSAAVDPFSLPNGGPALGSINIIDATQGNPTFGQAAVGSFTVIDDPALSVGNHQRVLFVPTLPGNPNAPCTSGLQGQSTYQITVPRTGTSTQVLRVGGQPIQNSATTCFKTCGCPNPMPCVSSFTDPVAGPPFVVSTTPPAGNPAPPPIDTASIPGNTVSILVSEALNPAQMSLANVRVVSSATNSQVPGTLIFHQAGSLPGMASNSRIDYVASGPLPGGVTYQILLSPAVVDFGGNPIQPVQGNPSAQLYFQVMPTLCPQPPIVETFDTTTNRDLVTGALDWSGTGVLQGTFPTVLTGTGSDGAFNPPPGQLTILDTNQLVSGQSRMGYFDFTDVNISANAIVRIIGPYVAHVRCTGAFTLNGIIDVSAGLLAWNAANSWDRGPQQGQVNNNGGSHCYALGGQTSAGGGPGGTGSGVTPPAGSPPTFGCTTRTLNGEAGYGPFIGGVLNSGVPSNSFYGGGQGGMSECFPYTASPGCNIGDVGGLGGAGGSAGRIGEAGLPRAVATGCTPVTPQPTGVAQPGPVPVAMTPPIGVPSAGSGGGGGGDHFRPVTPIPSGDDQGGGGGGAGGGVRISCVGAFTMGTATTPGVINSVGSVGGTAPVSAGAGGSGSGGEVWIQSFSTVTISSSSGINVDGPGRVLPTAGNIGCTNQASGGGGDGLVQIEAGQGPTPTPSFNLQPTPTSNNGAVFSAPPFQFAGSVVGQAQSVFRYTGSGAPVYTGAIEAFSLGNAAGATLSIRYEGAHEAVNSTPQVPVFDPATIKSTATGGGPITAANISELNGYAFVRFVVNVSYPSPPATGPTAILPSVDTITIAYNAAINCP